MPGWLQELARREARPGPYTLDLMRELLARLGDPQLGVPALHVAGTRGKGSTCALLAAALDAAGRRVGLTTSPHLVHPRERIRIGADDLDGEAFAELVERVRRAAGDLRPSFFEMIVAAAFLAFRDARVEVAVVEVGLGGRLDATNLCRPAVTAITRLGLDHADRLGDTRVAVAREKAGILKPGVPAVVAPGAPEALAEIRRVAAAVGAPLVEVSAEDVAAALPTSLAGRCQAENAAVAEAVLRELSRFEGGRLAVDAAAMRCGFAAVRWPARLQRACWQGIELLVDVAHDAESVRELTEHVAPGAAPAAVVFTCLGDKDLESMAGLLAASPPFARAIYLVPELDDARARPARETAAALTAAGLTARPAGSVREALTAAVERARAVGAGVAAFGSFRVAGAVLEVVTEPA